MKQKMQVIIPMTGIGKRFLDAGYTAPKPLIEVEGEPIIRHLVEKFPKEWSYVFICNSDHIRATNLKEVLSGLNREHKIVEIPSHNLGPVYAVASAFESIDDNLPTIVSYCDFSFSWDSDHFSSFVKRTDCDGSIISYRGFHPHYLGPTMYAYCREQQGKVREIREKQCFTENRQNEYASAGLYYFKSGSIVKRYFKQALSQNLSLNGEFYVSLVYNLLISDSLDIRIYEIPFFLQWGTPEDLQDFLYWNMLFSKFSRFNTDNAKKVKSLPQLLMPMGGMGSRFRKEGYPPKPLCAVLNQPMFKTAVNFLPCSSENPIFVLRKDIENEIRNLYPNSTSVVLDAETEGQAITCLKAKDFLNLDQPILVSACDHGLLWNQNQWQALMDLDPDMVVFTQVNYPDCRRNPNSYAYVQPNGDRPDGIGKIRSVSVKKPLSQSPQKDLVLVGTFYFRKTQLMLEFIQKLIDRDERVNGEFYLDSIVNLCIQSNLKVYYFNCDGYLGWGNPNALKEFNYWHDYFMGIRFR